MKGSTVTNAVKTVGAITVVPAVGLLGGPAVVVIACTLLAVIGALCWVIADRRRSLHLAMLIRTIRGGGTT